MLIQLTIHNLVIVERLTLDFNAGLSVLTGETGAGKSILLEALGLTLGGKASAEVIRAGCEKAEVHSLFSLEDCTAAQHWLETQDLAEEETQCVLRRVVVRGGRSRAYINGRPVTQAMLQALGALLLNLHGQHAHQALLQPAAQRHLLDAYANLSDQVAQLGVQYRAWQVAQDDLQALQQAADERESRLDYLRFQLGELEPVLELAAHTTALEAEHQRLAHATQLQAVSTAVLQQLQERDQALSTQLGQVIQELNAVVAFDSALAPVIELLDSAAIQVDEAAQSVRRYLDQLEVDPEQLQELDKQLATLHDMARKHRVEIGQLPTLATNLRQELADLLAIDQQVTTLTAAVDQQQRLYQQQAEQLSTARQVAAQRLAQTVSQSMQALGMQQGCLQVVCEPGTPSQHGIDQIRFLVATNPGQPVAALSRIVSGGELSRIALAIQVATSGCSQVPTLIFDEVDVGIGGAIAEIVGQLLRHLGQQTQVICVTHLAQVAAQAHHHYQVQKHQIAAVSQTHIQVLDDTERVQEIARMLGGVEITEQSRRHAAEMMVLAQKNG